MKYKVKRPLAYARAYIYGHTEYIIDWPEEKMAKYQEYLEKDIHDELTDEEDKEYQEMLEELDIESQTSKIIFDPEKDMEIEDWNDGSIKDAKFEPLEDLEQISLFDQVNMFDGDIT